MIAQKTPLGVWGVIVLAVAVATGTLSAQTPGGQIPIMGGVLPVVTILGSRSMAIEVGGVKYTLPTGVLTLDETLSNGVENRTRPTLDQSGSKVVFKSFSLAIRGAPALWGANYVWHLQKGTLELVARRGDKLRFPPACCPEQPPETWGSSELIWSGHPEWGWNDQSVVFHTPRSIMRWISGKTTLAGYPDGGWFLPSQGLVETRQNHFLVSAYRAVGNTNEGNILEVGPPLTNQKTFPYPLRNGYWQFERTTSGELGAKPIPEPGMSGWVAPNFTLRWTGSAWTEVIVTPPPPPAPPTATLTVNRSSVNPGESVTLSWTTTGATGVSIDQGVGPVPASGTRIITPASTTQWTLTAQGAGGVTTTRVTVSVLVPKPPVIVTSVGHLYGSTPATSGFAPDSGISIYGSGLAGGLPPYPFGTALGFPLPDRLNGARVLVDGQPLRLYYTTGGQINAVLPPSLGVGVKKLIVQRWDINFTQFENESAPVEIRVVRIAPAFVTFTPEGERNEWPAIQLADGGFATPQNPVPLGQTVVIYLTGLGAKKSNLPYGSLRNEPTGSQEEVRMVFRVNDRPVEGKVVYSGTTVFPGLEQINVQVPDASLMGMVGSEKADLYMYVVVDDNITQTFTLVATATTQ